MTNFITITHKVINTYYSKRFDLYSNPLQSLQSINYKKQINQKLSLLVKEGIKWYRKQDTM